MSKTSCNKLRSTRRKASDEEKRQERETGYVHTHTDSQRREPPLEGGDSSSSPGLHQRASEHKTVQQLLCDFFSRLFVVSFKSWMKQISFVSVKRRRKRWQFLLKNVSASRGISRQYSLDTQVTLGSSYINWPWDKESLELKWNKLKLPVTLM